MKAATLISIFKIHLCVYVYLCLLANAKRYETNKKDAYKGENFFSKYNVYVKTKQNTHTYPKIENQNK